MHNEASVSQIVAFVPSARSVSGFRSGYLRIRSALTEEVVLKDCARIPSFFNGHCFWQSRAFASKRTGLFKNNWIQLQEQGNVQY
jgi:hypothetical protein